MSLNILFLFVDVTPKAVKNLGIDLVGQFGQKFKRINKRYLWGSACSTDQSLYILVVSSLGLFSFLGHHHFWDCLHLGDPFSFGKDKRIFKEGGWTFFRGWDPFFSQAQPKPASQSPAGGWDTLIITTVGNYHTVHTPRIVDLGSYRASASSQLVGS